MDTYV